MNFNSIYFFAEMQVTQSVLKNVDYGTIIDWTDEMDIEVYRIIISDPNSSNEIKLMAIVREIQTITKIISNKHC